MQSQPGTRGRPGTPSLLRELNDRAALDLLLGGEMLTRSQISEYTGVSKVTVSQMLTRLEERGLVAIAGEQAGGRGPNAALYSVVPSSAYVAGLYVDFDLVSICDTVTLDTPVYSLIWDRVSISPPSRRSSAARSFSSRSRLGVPGRARVPG